MEHSLVKNYGSTVKEGQWLRVWGHNKSDIYALCLKNDYHVSLFYDITLAIYNIA